MLQPFDLAYCSAEATTKVVLEPLLDINVLELVFPGEARRIKLDGRVLVSAIDQPVREGVLGWELVPVPLVHCAIVVVVDHVQRWEVLQVKGCDEVLVVPVVHVGESNGGRVLENLVVVDGLLDLPCNPHGLVAVRGSHDHDVRDIRLSDVLHGIAYVVLIPFVTHQ